MQMQFEIGQDKCIKVILDRDVNVEEKVIDTKRQWIQSIVHCQKDDKGGYGSRFPILPMFRSKTTYTRELWTLSGMLVCVKQLCNRTDKCQIVDSRWNGWLLFFLTKKCFKGCIVRSDNINRMISKNV